MTQRRGVLNEPALAHKNEFGENAEMSVSVSQPTTILGIFSEYIKGWSLVCNTDEGITITISRRIDNLVRVVNLTKQDKKKFTISSIKYRREDKWANAVKAVFSELLRSGVKTNGFNILISGKGCTVSASSLFGEICVGLITAFNKFLNLGWDKTRIISIALSSASFSPEITLRYRDIWLLVNAERGKVYLFDEKKMEMKGFEYSFTGAKSYVFDSSLPYSVLTPEYDEFKLSIPRFTRNILSLSKANGDLRNLSEREIRYYTSSLSESERRGLMFLTCTSENARLAFESITKHDEATFSRMLSSSQRSLMTNADLTSPEIDWIFRRSKENSSVLGLSSIDNGSAGSFLCVVDEEYEFPNNQRSEEYERIFGFHPKSIPFYPSSGVEIE